MPYGKRGRRNRPARYKTKIKRNDIVTVIAGGSKHVQGRVLEVNRKRGKLMVEGAAMVKKHVRPNPQKQIKGGVASRHSMIDFSNVKLVDD